MMPVTLVRAERLTLAVLMCGVASLALSDFVSPGYWLLAALAAVLRLLVGPRLALSELQASLIGWGGFVWVGLELAMGRAWVVAFTDFLLILSLAVTIEAATPRNHLHRMLVGLFLLLAAAVLTDSVLYIFPVAAFLWFMWRAAACLYGLNWPGGDLPGVAPGRDARLMLGIALATAAGFVLLPRFDVHSVLKPTQPRMQISGFTDEVQLGDFARELDPTVVLRIEAVGVAPERMERLLGGRYWRGVPLGRFTGSGWERLMQADIRRTGRGQDLRLGSGEGFGIAVFREASNHPYLQLPAGVQVIHDLPEPALMDAGGALRFEQAPARRLRIRMDVAARPAMLPDLAAPLPDERDISRVPPELTAWVRSLAEPGDTPAQTLSRVVAELQSWQYDLHAPIDAAHPVVSFLKSRRGHCELYATALALAARALGFPSRVVNGYYGGEWNDVGSFLLIRQQHAHSWVEVWQAGGWQRLDATPPARWQLSGVRFPLLDDVWETVRLSWYRYVLEFQNQDRTGLVRSVWQAVHDYGAKTLAVAVVLLLLGIGVRMVVRLLRRTASPIGMVDRWLLRHGIERLPHQPLRCLPAPAGIGDAAWQGFVRGWEMQAYAGVPAWSRARTRRELRALSA
ncbi:MAG TPA: DUF3488 and transglutaminase-like domain-containing protein [Mariprofundaceae bacterium]|nr:DUF3488 and transglutaminase-like domain-containing protein [Mariprofundaceae bacterium]